MHSTLVNGKKINNMVMEKKHGQMVHAMKEHIYKEENMEQENLFGLIAQSILVYFAITILKERESIIGRMVDLLKENGGITKCMDMEFSCGPMEGDMNDSTIWIKNKETVLFIGLTEESILDNGLMVNSMGRGPLLLQTESKKKENGIMVNV